MRLFKSPKHVLSVHKLYSFVITSFLWSTRVGENGLPHFITIARLECQSSNIISEGIWTEIYLWNKLIAISFHKPLGPRKYFCWCEKWDNSFKSNHISCYFQVPYIQSFFLFCIRKSMNGSHYNWKVLLVPIIEHSLYEISFCNTGNVQI